MYAQHLLQGQPGSPRAVAKRIRDRGDQRTRSVAGHRRDDHVAAAENAHSVLGDVGSIGGIRWVWQIVAENALNASGWWPEADHDQARFRDEAEQVRHDSEKPGRVNDTHFHQF